MATWQEYPYPSYSLYMFDCGTFKKAQDRVKRVGFQTVEQARKEAQRIMAKRWWLNSVLIVKYTGPCRTELEEIVRKEKEDDHD